MGWYVRSISLLFLMIILFQEFSCAESLNSDLPEGFVLEDSKEVSGNSKNKYPGSNFESSGPGMLTAEKLNREAEVHTGNDSALPVSDVALRERMSAFIKANEGVEPTSLIDYFTRASAFIILGDSDKAIPYLTFCIENKYKLEQSFLLRAAIYADKGDKRALADYSKAIELDFKSAGVADLYFRRALIYEKNGDLGSALSDYTKAIENKPDFLDAYNFRAFVYKKMNNYEKAILDYSYLISKNYKLEHTYLKRGNIYNQKGFKDEAISDYSQAIKINPNFLIVYSSRANAYQEKGDYEKSIQDFTQLINNNYDLSGSYGSRGLIYSLLCSYDLAIFDFTKSLEIRSNSIIYYSRGFVYYKQGVLDKAVADFNKAREINPKYATDYYDKYDKIAELKKIEIDKQMIQLDQRQAELEYESRLMDMQQEQAYKQQLLKTQQESLKFQKESFDLQKREQNRRMFDSSRSSIGSIQTECSSDSNGFTHCISREGL